MRSERSRKREETHYDTRYRGAGGNNSANQGTIVRGVVLCEMAVIKGAVTSRNERRKTEKSRKGNNTIMELKPGTETESKRKTDARGIVKA